jgi:hypothetical protein
MLSFHLVREGSALQVHCDDRGLDALIDVLKKLRGSGTHVHLWAPSIAGEAHAALSDTSPFGEEALPEVIITHGGD